MSNLLSVDISMDTRLNTGTALAAGLIIESQKDQIRYLKNKVRALEEDNASLRGILSRFGLELQAKRRGLGDD